MGYGRFAQPPVDDEAEYASPPAKRRQLAPGFSELSVDSQGFAKMPPSSAADASSASPMMRSPEQSLLFDAIMGVTPTRESDPDQVFDSAMSKSMQPLPGVRTGYTDAVVARSVKGKAKAKAKEKAASKAAAAKAATLAAAAAATAPAPKTKTAAPKAAKPADKVAKVAKVADAAPAAEKARKSGRGESTVFGTVKFHMGSGRSYIQNQVGGKWHSIWNSSFVGHTEATTAAWFAVCELQVTQDELDAAKTMLKAGPSSLVVFILWAPCPSFQINSFDVELSNFYF